MRLCMDLCVPVYVSTGLHTCAVLLLYQRYSEE